MANKLVGMLRYNQGIMQWCSDVMEKDRSGDIVQNDKIHVIS